jgi:uncharacterized protein YhdP
MKKNIFSLWRISVIFLASLLGFLIVFVLLGHGFSFYLNQKPQKIEQFVANLLNKPLQVQKFQMSWSGLNPVFKGNQVVVWNVTKTKPLFHIQQLVVSVDLLKTLLTGGQLHLKQVSGRGAVLTLRQTSDHQLSIDGLNNLSSLTTQTTASTAINTLLAGFFSEPRVSLEAVELHFYPASGVKWPTMRLDLWIDNTKSFHQLNAQLQFLDYTPSTLRLIAKFAPLTDPAWTLKDLQAKLYLQGEQVVLNRWLALWTQGYTLQNATTDFKLWANWQQERFTEIQTQITSKRTTAIKIPQASELFTVSPFFASLKWQSSPQKEPSLEGFVKNLRSQPWGHFPGIAGLNAYLHWTPTAGQFSTRSKNILFQAPSFFEKPLHFDQFVSDLAWQKKDKQWQIQIPKLFASNADLKLNAQIGLEIPPDPKQSHVRLFAGVQTNQAKAIANYLPIHLISPQVQHWLNTAILQGSSQAKIVMQGPLDAFPFDQQQGTFLADIPIQNGALRYEATWPPLEKINGRLTFAQRQMQMHIDSAQILNTPLKNIEAKIPLLKKGVQAVLTLTAEKVTSRLEQVNEFLKLTPLREKLGNAFSELLLSGPVSLNLQVIIPLEKGSQTLKINGEGQIEQAMIDIPARQLQLQQVNGAFTLTEKGFTTKNLQALLWGKPLHFAIHATPKIQIDLDYDGLQTQLIPEKEGLRFSIDNALAKGSLFIPDEKGAVWEAEFSSVKLDALSDTATNVFHFKKIPPLDVQINDLRYQDRIFGNVAFELRPNMRGLGISQLQAGSANYHLTAQGQWTQQQRDYSDFQGQLDSSRLSDFLADCGLPASVNAQQAHIKFNLQWPGAPYAFHLPTLQGNLFFKATNGQLIDIGSSAEAKVNFGRLLNFLSLQSLGRRLQLDFSDLQAKGFDFTELEGNLILREGNALTRDFKIEGPVASITINGRIGLVNKDYNLTINVVPHFTSSLPVLVGLAGGPIAGAVTWIVNSVLGSTVQKIAETSFQMTGTWGNPHIQKNN